MKIVFISHPISGDVPGNIKKIIAIARHINLTEPDVVPFVPYLIDLYSLDDNEPKERERGLKNGVAVFNNSWIEEVRLYGDRITEGMNAEIELAKRFDTPVRPMTPETKAMFK